MITEDYVSFETAKLLKEKGFDEKCPCSYRKKLVDNKIVDEEELFVSANLMLTNSELEEKSYRDIVYCSAPTIQMAMKWLREKYNLHIGVLIIYQYFPRKYEAHIMHTEKHEDIVVNPGTNFNTNEDAGESAIKYCLKNLIKNEDEEEESDIPVPKTVDEAISTLEKILSDEDKEYLLKNGAISMHNSLGRWIRNEWGLWTGSELKDELMNLNKGLNHPDDMSNYIIEEFIKYCLS